jgi:hypothetical protein
VTFVQLPREEDGEQRSEGLEVEVEGQRPPDPRVGYERDQPGAGEQRGEPSVSSSTGRVADPDERHHLGSDDSEVLVPEQDGAMGPQPVRRSQKDEGQFPVVAEEAQRELTVCELVEGVGIEGVVTGQRVALELDDAVDEKAHQLQPEEANAHQAQSGKARARQVVSAVLGVQDERETRLGTPVGARAFELPRRDIPAVRNRPTRVRQHLQDLAGSAPAGAWLGARHCSTSLVHHARSGRSDIKRSSSCALGLRV